MRTRRFLLVTTALSTAALAAACGKETSNNMPGNPKGMTYEDGGYILPRATATTAPDASPPTDAPVTATATATATVEKPRPLPGNPKGSRYDAGRRSGPDDMR